MIDPLIEPTYQCHFDPDDSIIWITYRELLIPSTTVSVYAWLGMLFDELPDNHDIYGCIFDFCDVTDFTPANLTADKITSTTFRAQHAEKLQTIPTGLLVQNTYQEMMVRTSMRLSKQQEVDEYPRVKVVKSLDEALTFFHKWHGIRIKGYV